MNTVSLNADTLIDHTQQALAERLGRAGLSAAQARAVFKSLHRFGITDPYQMPEVSPNTAKFLINGGAGSLDAPLRLSDTHHSADGTIKLRFELSGGLAVESVVIPAGERLTLCVSSQAGCAAGCTFCHTGTMGLLRNLSAGEIVGQRHAAQAYLNESDYIAPNGQRVITNIVFMGMGEPLHNEDAVARTCEILGDDCGAGFPNRRLVVSTAGVGNRIKPFWQRSVAALSLSLHAADDDVRSRIVPLNRQWNTAALKSILMEIPWRARESLSVAYLLLADVNDRREDAEKLADWVRGLPAKVNLLEFNPYPGSTYDRASPEKLAQFRHWLDDLNVFHTHRVSRGRDALAACGQLADAPNAHRRVPIGFRQRMK